MDVSPSPPPAAAATPPILALLTDFGTADGYPGVMHGVILGHAPTARIVHLSHEVPAQDIVAGAWLLHTAWRSFPLGTIFVCVVDPGVGGARRALACAVDGRYFVGPDNGLFSYVYADGTLGVVVQLDNPRYHLGGGSATFHGRDIFAPCAAHLANGTPLAVLGSPVDAATLVTFALPQPVWQGATLLAHVTHIDRFGNLLTDVAPPLTAGVLAAPQVAAQIGAAQVTARGRTFGDGAPDTPLLLADSSGHLAIAVRNGSAAALLGVTRGAEVALHGVPHDAS